MVLLYKKPEDTVIWSSTVSMHIYFPYIYNYIMYIRGDAYILIVHEGTNTYIYIYVLLLVFQ